MTAFVVFEGGDGAGKSTQVELLAAALVRRHIPVVTTREPGGTPIAEQIRAVLLSHTAADLSARAEALLFAAARAEHAAKVLRPALERGEVVLSDRYVDSSIAYQGAARGLGQECISALSAWATEDLVPDLTVLLDVSPAVGLARAGEPNRMEAEPGSFHEVVRAAFLAQAAKVPERYLVLPAEWARERIAGEVLARVLALTQGQATREPAS